MIPQVGNGTAVLNRWVYQNHMQTFSNETGLLAAFTHPHDSEKTSPIPVTHTETQAGNTCTGMSDKACGPVLTLV